MTTAIPLSRTGLQAGTAEINITPAPGCDMIHRRADGIHDGLWARTLAFACAGQRVAIVGLDLIALSREQIAQVRERVHELCGLAPAELLLCCSHTHSGPTTNHFRGWGHGDPAYLAGLVEQVAQGVSAAFAKLTPCRLRYGTAPLQVGHNRRVDFPDGTAHMLPNPSAPVDKEVRVPGVEDAATGELKGLLFSHACHPVVLHLSTTQVTSDYPGRAAEFARKGYETAGDSYADPSYYAYKRYGTLALTPDCEAAVRQGVAETLARLGQGAKPPRDSAP
jgi:hypothetical protein